MTLLAAVIVTILALAALSLALWRAKRGTKALQRALQGRPVRERPQPSGNPGDEIVGWIVRDAPAGPLSGRDGNPN